MSENLDASELEAPAPAAPPRKGIPVWALVVIAVAAVGLGFLLATVIANIAGKKAEATMPAYAPVVTIDESNMYDMATWGQNFPAQYQGLLDTANFAPALNLPASAKLTNLNDPLALMNPKGLNMAETSLNPAKQNVSPADSDTIKRDWVTPEKISQDPRLLKMWTGYAFALDYRHLRGHAYNLIDQRNTMRVSSPPRGQPGSCANCHASLPGILSILGQGTPDKPVTITNYSYGDPTMMAAWDAMNSMKYLQPDANSPDLAGAIDKQDPNGAKGLYGYIKAAGMDKPMGCIDCHDPDTMKLRITRPALINALHDMKAEQGVKDYDVNRDATQQEMRSLVCAQCHVEYYFAPAAGKDKDGNAITPPAGTTKPNTVVFPWKYGTNIDDIWAYYQNPDNFPAIQKNFTDFTSGITGAAVLKAQHPEYEAWSQGVHAANGVTCADCHMQYQRQGAQKVSNHDVQSPMNDINGSCGTCHTASTDTLKNRVIQIQTNFKASRDAALDSLSTLIDAIKAAKDAGTVSEDTIAAALKFQDKASFYADFGASENSYGFHAPDFFQRVFVESIEASRQGQLVLAGVDPATFAPSANTTANQEAAAKAKSGG